MVMYTHLQRANPHVANYILLLHAGHPAQIPPAQPQQLRTPIPHVRRMSETMLTTPSPSTNPLAMTIKRISCPPVFATLRWYQYSINPPTKRANENDGVFKNPIANATPEGIHLAYRQPRWTAMSLKLAITENSSPNSNMNKRLFSGSCPFPIPFASTAKSQCHTPMTYEAGAPG